MQGARCRPTGFGVCTWRTWNTWNWSRFALEAATHTHTHWRTRSHNQMWAEVIRSNARLTHEYTIWNVFIYSVAELQDKFGFGFVFFFFSLIYLYFSHSLVGRAACMKFKMKCDRFSSEFLFPIFFYYFVIQLKVRNNVSKLWLHFSPTLQHECVYTWPSRIFAYIEMRSGQVRV